MSGDPLAGQEQSGAFAAPGNAGAARNFERPAPSLRAGGRAALHDVTALVRGELEEVNRIVEEALRPKRSELRELLGHVGAFRGKQLRPALCLLVAKALGGLGPVHLKVAAILEMIHSATLIHDDILDGALVRRNLACLHEVYGHEVSVLIGDYIYARAFQMSVELPDTRCSRLLAEITRVVCQGEVTQILHRFDLSMSEELYLSVIGEKTASLYAASAELGALYAGAGGPTVEAMREFGYALGLAFQIIDDCLDVEGEEAVVGKSLGTDVGKGKLTLPFLHLLGRLDRAGRSRFREILRAGDPATRQARLAAEFDLRPGLDYAHDVADRWLRRARTLLDGLPGGKEVEALRSMTDFVLHRRN